MRKMFFTLALAMASAPLFAQVLDVASIEKIDLKGAGSSVVTGISPQGNYLLLSDAQLNGLAKYDLSTKTVKVISSARSAGLNVAISSDGNSVAYREDSFVDGLRYSDLKVLDLTSGENRQLAKGVRNLNAVSLQGKTAVMVAGGRMTKTATIGGRAARKTAPVASIVNSQLVLDVNGRTTTLSPNGTEYSYIWPSVSPDGTKVCYFVCGRGCYVCDLKGNIVAELGKLHAAKWLDNNTIVAMNDTDNGVVITSSAIVAASLDGKRQTLTDAGMKAMYPYATADGKKVVFTTDEGETYMINIK